MLDTNIVLSFVLPNDSTYEISNQYLKECYLRYVSDTSCKESNKKIYDIKELSLSISEFVKGYSLENNVDFLNFDKNISKVKKNYIKNYENNDFPINVPKNRFEDMVTNFFKVYDEQIKKILIESDNDDLNICIRNAFTKSNIKLNIFLEDNICITIKSSVVDVNNLKKIGLDEKDAILLNEAYNLHLTLKSQVNFVTFDKGILSLKNKIFELISKNVIVSNPIEFVSIPN